MKVAPLCLTLCDPMDCSPPGSSVHGILQARILEWVAIPFSRVYSQPRDWTQVSCIGGGFFTVWVTREALWATRKSCKRGDIYSNIEETEKLSMEFQWKTLAPWKKSYDKPRQHIKNQRHYFANKGPSNQSYGLSSSHVWMWELDHKESWAPKNWWTMVLEKTVESHLDCKEIKPDNPKVNQPWIFIGRTDAEAEAPTLWLPDVKSWLIRKDPDAGQDWRQKEKGTTEDEMVGWCHWLNGLEWTGSRTW